MTARVDGVSVPFSYFCHFLLILNNTGLTPRPDNGMSIHVSAETSPRFRALRRSGDGMDVRHDFAAQTRRGGCREVAKVQGARLGYRAEVRRGRRSRTPGVLTPLAR